MLGKIPGNTDCVCHSRGIYHQGFRLYKKIVAPEHGRSAEKPGDAMRISDKLSRPIADI